MSTKSVLENIEQRLLDRSMRVRVVRSTYKLFGWERTTRKSGSWLRISREDRMHTNCRVVATARVESNGRHASTSVVFSCRHGNSLRGGRAFRLLLVRHLGKMRRLGNIGKTIFGLITCWNLNLDGSRCRDCTSESRGTIR